MNNHERNLLRYIVDGDMHRARMQAQLVLEGITTKRDEEFKHELLRKLSTKPALAELPQKLKGILVAEETANFPEERFLFRDAESDVVRKIIQLYKASGRLEKLGIPYLPALMLHGQSGCGKTLLAKYIAYKVDLPYVYVRFSNLVDSLLGATQQNIAKVFDFVRETPCVLCFDEIDAVGIARGQKGEVGEMSRVVIALMQEMDNLPNNVIIIGTTNRFRDIDPALARRFPLIHEVEKLTTTEARALARKFIKYTGLETAIDLDKWCDTTFTSEMPASEVVKQCTETITTIVINQVEECENGIL